VLGIGLDNEEDCEDDGEDTVEVSQRREKMKLHLTLYFNVSKYLQHAYT